jgi:cell shape-determining protein MreC
MKKISMVFVLILVLVSLSACSSDKVRTSVTTPESDSPSGLDATSSAVINDKSEVKSYEKAPSGKEKVQTPIEPVQKKEQPKEKQSEKNQIVEQPIKQTKDLTGWVEYDTSDLSLLAKYIAEGKVVKQGGKYWASP